MVDRHALLHKTFVAMDADGSGFVDESEFLSIFDDHEVKHAKARMAEIDLVSGSDDGLIGAEEFCKFMLEYMIAMQDQAFKHKVARWQENVKGSHRKLLLRRVFKKMDVDGSDSVSLAEFGALNDEVGTASSAALFKEIEAAEGNGDGELTSDEWVPFVLNQQKDSSDEEFEHLCYDWLDVLSRKRRETLLRAAFFKMDVDSSGSVDMEEFANLKVKEKAQHDPIIRCH